MRYDLIVGTGGIGTGILFELEGNRALSRNETRLAQLSPARDYCKQHIILHYLAKTLCPEASVFPIGMVGDDDAGAGLLRQMEAAGMDVSLVARSSQRPTMYCVCMQYPDKAICNVTTSESACALVDPAYIRDAVARLPRPMDGRTVAVAAPEVPVAARLELLRRAKEAGAFCVASCLVDEFDDFAAGGGTTLTDLMVINEDEAAACCGLECDDMKELARACYDALRAANPGIRLVMTCGAAGSFACADGRVVAVPARRVDPVATGGAGDAYTAGTICGLALGLPFLPGGELSAPELGAMLAAESVVEADTIAWHIDRSLVTGFVKANRR